MSTRADKSVQTTMARALTLLQDGYRPRPVPNQPGVYIYHRPVGVPAAAGESSTYRVDAINEMCECQMFLTHATCKHLVQCRALVAMSLYVLSPYLPEAHMPIAQEFDLEQILCDLFNADQRETQWLSRLTDDSDLNDLLPPPDDTCAPPSDDDELVRITPQKSQPSSGFTIPRPTPSVNTTAGFG